MHGAGAKTITILGDALGARNLDFQSPERLDRSRRPTTTLLLESLRYSGVLPAGTAWTHRETPP